MGILEDYCRGVGARARDLGVGFARFGNWRRRRSSAWPLLILLSCLATSCSSDDSEDADGATTADGGLIDALAAPDSPSCANALCGTVAYAGAYTGPAAPIYIHVYRETGSVTDNPTAAVGDPDFSAARTGAGDFQVDIDGYEGNLYLSAFMDVDGSGEQGGPSGNAEISHGVYSDPMGAYGGYTFEGSAATEPTPIAFSSAGVAGIDIELTDSGVITGVIHEGGGGAGAVVVGAFAPVANGKFWHHTHAPAFSDGMVYFLAIPPGDHWLIRANVGSGSVGFYPNNPPPAPPANASPVGVTANAITENIDITLGGA